MIIVVEPGLKSLETAARIKKLAKDIGVVEFACVINKVLNKKEEEFVRMKLREMDLDVIGTMPQDELVVKADTEGKSLLDYQESKALKSIKKIAENILSQMDEIKT